MKRFVLDCSIAMTWCFEDEKTDLGDSILESLDKGSALVPGIWPLEVANVLAMAERKGRITEAESTRFLEMLSALPIAVDTETGGKAFKETLLLARHHKISVYDSAYLELAMREGLSFATADKELLRAAREAGVKLLVK